MKIVNLIEQMYRNSESIVRVRGNASEPFPVETGVKQGALLSPFLFNIVLDVVLEHALADFDGIKVDEGNGVTDLDYADDIALLAETAAEMQLMVDSLKDCAAAMGLIISAEKTKSMRSPEVDRTPILLSGQPLADVSSFCYLGSTLSIDGDASVEIHTRLAKARNAFSMLHDHLGRSQEVNKATKLRVFNVLVRPVLLYAC